MGKRDADDIWIDPEEVEDDEVEEAADDEAQAQTDETSTSDAEDSDTDADADAAGSSSDDEPAAADEPADEGEWVDDDARQKRAVAIAQIALVIIVLLGVVVVLAVKSGDDGDGGSGDSAKAGTEAQADGGTSDTTSEEDQNKPARWPGEFNGRPAALGKIGQAPNEVQGAPKPGVYVWSDFDGWHAWVVSGPGVPPTVTGTANSNDEFSRATAVDPSGQVVLQGRQVSFEFPTDVKITGMDFNLGFFSNRVVFNFNGPDGPIDPKLVFAGSKAVTPQQPLVLEKTK